MSVGLSVRGRSETPGWIDALRERLAALEHPAAEAIEVDDDGTVTATTTPAGPGYHVAVCEALDAAARDLAITWARGGDATGYLDDRDLAAVERHMLQWLSTLATWALEQPDASGIRLAMPRSHAYQVDGIHTPTGPRDRAWLAAVAADPTRGLDFFPWWTPGENAAGLLGTARCLMWTEVRWRPPTDDDEEALEEEVRDLLARAWALDPTLDYPAREWIELHGDVPDELRARAATLDGPRLGYRRYPVRVTLAGGWSVEIPGELSEEWDDGTWSAWHDGRTVWFDGYQRDAPAAELVEAVPADGEVLRRVDGDVVKKAYLSEGDDGFILSTRNAVDGKLCVSTIVYPTEAERDWAIATWASFRAG